MPRRLSALLTVAALAVLLPLTARASDPVTATRGYDLELGLRAHALSIPDAVLNAWYFDERDPGWPTPEVERPRAHGQAFGLEVVVRSRTVPDRAHDANGIFYVEWVHSSLKEGYWDDVEEPAQHGDGDYLIPSRGFGFVTAGASYAYEVHLLRAERTHGALGVSALAGGGLGLAVKLGDLHHLADCGLVDCPADARIGEPVRFGRAFPLIDATLGLRFTIAERVVVRLEGGLHTVVSYGATAGIRF